MEEERIEEVLAERAEAPSADARDDESRAEAGGVHSEDQHRTPVTILFSDIKGSTTYFEQKGDLEGVAMLERHNSLLLPCIENNNGRLIKTIGDALMTLFTDPVDAARAAVEMQQSLFDDGRDRPESEQIHIRIGIHSGLGLLRDQDVFGDVVNAAARVQALSQPDQILITDSIVSAAETAGYQTGKLGRTKLEGKEEAIEIYAMSWSPQSAQRLIDDLQARYEEQLAEMRQLRTGVEEELDTARTGWRQERRRLHSEIDHLEDGIRDASQSARDQVTEEFREELRFELETALKARKDAEQALASAHERFESERVGYRAQIESLEKRLVETLEKANNPSRLAAEVESQVQSRIERDRQQWQRQWDAERQDLERELERLRTAISRDPVARARQLVEERLRSKQASDKSVPSGEEESLEMVRLERDALQKRVEANEAETASLEDSIRRSVTRELRQRNDLRSEQAERVQAQLEQKIRSLEQEIAAQRESLSDRIRSLEASVPEAQEATRRQTRAELEAEFQERVDELERERAAVERHHRDDAEDWDSERSQLMSRLEALEGKLEEARDLVFRRSSEPTVDELNRLRDQLEGDFRLREKVWMEEKLRLLERLEVLEDSGSND